MPPERDTYKSMALNHNAPTNNLRKLMHQPDSRKNSDDSASSFCINCNKPFSSEFNNINYCNECAALQIECSHCGNQFIPKNNENICPKCILEACYNSKEIEKNQQHPKNLETTTIISSKIEKDINYELEYGNPLFSFEYGDFREKKINKKKEDPVLKILMDEYKLINSKIILYSINESKKDLNLSTLIKILKGISSIELELSHLPTFSILNHCSINWIENLIEELISLQILQVKTVAGKESLIMTSKGFKLISNYLPDPKSEYGNYDVELYEKLRKLRNQIAAEKNYPSFIICNNTTLTEMTIKKPINDKSMLEIKGVGIKFLENYGLDFQKIIKEHCSQEENITKNDVRQNSYSKKSDNHQTNISEDYSNLSDEELLEILFHSDNSPKRAKIAHFLGESKNSKYISALCKSTLDPDGNVRRLSASALGKLKNKRAEDSLINLLYDNKAQVRQYAIKALGELGTTKSIAHLNKLLNDSKKYNRCSAKTAISRIKSRNNALSND